MSISSIIKSIIKTIYIFNDVILASKLKVIQTLPKSDMWNTQSRLKAKGLINRCFNIGNYITTVLRS